MQKSALYRIIALTGFTCIILSLALTKYYSSNIEDITKNTEKNFQSKLQSCNLLLNEVASNLNDNIKLKAYEAFEKEQIGLYTFQKDSLVFWNNAHWPLIDSLYALTNDFGTIKQKNGIYFYVRKKDGLNRAIALCLIQPHFEIQNNYLKNEYSEWTNLPKSVIINFNLNAGNLVQLNGKNLFSIESLETSFYNKWMDDFSFILFNFGCLLLMLTVLLLIFKTKKISTCYSILLLAIVLRFVLLFFKKPLFLYRTSLFDLRIFGNGQSIFNAYLGDILINAFIILFIAIALHFCFLKNKQNNTNWFYLFVQTIGLGFVFFQFNINLKSLVNNSTLNFDFINIFSSNWILLAVLAIYTSYSLALFVFLISIIKNLIYSKYTLIILMLVTLIICLSYFLSFNATNSLELFWLIYFVLIIYFVYKSSQQNITLTLATQVLLISFTGSSLLQNNLNQNQALDLELLAQYLSEKKDAILENEFNLIPQKISKDNNFRNLINVLPSSEGELIQKLKQEYFSGYFDRYNLDFSLFDENCNPLLPVKNQLLVNEGFFEDQIKLRSDTVAKGLYFLSTQKKPVQYIAFIPINTKKLYVLMEPKQFEETGSFPDLLIDQSLQKQKKLSNISFAVYHDKVLSNRIGDFNYPDIMQDSTHLTNNNTQFQHFYFKTDEGTDVIISETAKTSKYFFTYNSYLLLFFTILIYLCYLIYVFLFTSLLSNSSLTRRIQTIIIILLFFSLSAVGIISVNLVSKQFETKNQKQLSEKTQTIISELTTQFKVTQIFDSEQYNLLNLKLKEYARLFNTPISMFDANGRLVNTSENKLYDLGLASKLANPIALNNLKELKASSVCMNEKAGSLDYMSMYTSVFDANKKLIGLINLPYFAKQNDLSNELSGIISGLINVYVILFVLSILAGLILSGYITQPLRIIQQQIAKIAIGRKNEKISWNSKDEIGKLVFEYNLMLNKLEESALQLAQSERESAWREMAKQVAHEIKNPLTPMKLNLQYLQHLMKTNPDDFAERFERASAGIIEQIDSLANIASEFSNFAKLPLTQLQTINLVEVIASSVTLFESQQLDTIKNQIQQTQLLVKGDRDQCLRVFNNVFKNALHAIEEIPHPQISIQVLIEKEHTVISIIDNGCGIEEDLKSKIFTPNFTTKNTGSGLGLAMVKSCMQGFGGDVYFESEIKKGTTFYLKFVSA